jgi:hypothetical protein
MARHWHGVAVAVGVGRVGGPVADPVLALINDQHELTLMPLG